MYIFFFLIIRHHPRLPPFPNPPLSRSSRKASEPRRREHLRQRGHRLHQVQRTQEQPPADGVRDVSQDHPQGAALRGNGLVDRKSTRLNSSHANISYAVFCLKKKKHITI